MTSIYSAGTVSVTNGNAVVTGSGTAWSVAGVGGGMFSSAGVSVPIASVESDTSLTLAYPWPGTTAAGAVYAIQRDNSDAASVVDLYDRFSRILVTLSLIGIHPNDSGTIAKRDALTLTTDDEGFFFAHVEIGYDITLYRWTGTAWEGPFDIKGADGLPGVGAGGYGLPAGGATGQVPAKASGANGDVAWASASGIANDSGVSGTSIGSALDNLSAAIALAAANVAKRGTVRAATTGNVTISTALNNGDAIDGVTLATGDLVLVKSQTAPAENGIYVVGVTPARSTEFDTYNEHPGSLIVVQEGTTLADTFWYCTSNVGGTLGTTAINFQQMTVSLADDSVTNAKLANMANATIKGRSTAGTGDPEDLTMAQLKALLLASTVIREVLTANRTYYVRTDGNDGNTGLVNNSAGAFLTIQKAIDTAATLDLSIYSVTIQCGAGTGGTAGLTLKSFVGGGSIALQGDTVTPSNVTIATTSANCINALGVIGKYTVTGFKFTATTSGYAISAGGASKIDIGVVEFGACASGHIDAEQTAIVTFLNNYTISGGGTRHWFTTTGALIQCAGKTVTLTGTPAFSSGFLIASRDGGALISGNTFSGSATGPRYSVTYTAWADVAGAGASYLPGDVAGSTSSGGTYA